MASTARLVSPVLSQIRPIHSSSGSVRQVFVRRKPRFWSKQTLKYGAPFATALGYLYLTSTDDGFHADRFTVEDLPKEGNHGDELAWQLFMRFTPPRKIVRDTEDLTDLEKQKIAQAIWAVKNKEERTKIYTDLLDRINRKLKQQHFLGVGLPNKVALLTTDFPKAVSFYDYEAKGLAVSSSGIAWTSHPLNPRVATKMDNILSVPGIAFSAFMAAAYSHWRSSNIKPQVISSAKVTPEQGGSPIRSKSGTSKDEHPTSGTMTATRSSADTKALSSTTAPLPDESRIKSRPFFSQDNHVDIITSFLQQQKEAVRQSSGLPTNSARTFIATFWKEFQFARVMRSFETYEPPGGNVIFAVTVVLNGPKKRVVLAVEGDYDVTTETWGPIFIEPIESLRSRSRKRPKP